MRNRRDLLKIFALGALGGVLPLAAYRKLLAETVSPKLYFFRSEPGPPKARARFFLYEFEVASGAKRIVELDVDSPHSVILDTVRQRAVCLPRVGVKAAVVDLETFKVVEAFEASRGFYFYGHGDISPVTGELFLSQTDKNGNGLISIRDMGHYRELRQIESFGFAPHDIQFLKNGTLVVANNGWSEIDKTTKRKSSIVLLNPARNESVRLDKIEMPNPSLTVQHFSFDEPDHESGLPQRIFLGLDAPWPDEKTRSGESLAAVYHLSADRENNIRAGRLTTLEDRVLGIDGFQGNVLSIAGSKVVDAMITTTPQSFPALWDLRENCFVETILELPKPLGVNCFVDPTQSNTASFYITTTYHGVFRVDIQRDGAGKLKIKSITGVPGSEFLSNLCGHSFLRKA